MEGIIQSLNNSSVTLAELILWCLAWYFISRVDRMGAMRLNFPFTAVDNLFFRLLRWVPLVGTCAFLVGYIRHQYEKRTARYIIIRQIHTYSDEDVNELGGIESCRFSHEEYLSYDTDAEVIYTLSRKSGMFDKLMYTHSLDRAVYFKYLSAKYLVKVIRQNTPELDRDRKEFYSYNMINVNNGWLRQYLNTENE